MLSGSHGIMQVMPYDAETRKFQWEVPAKVLAVYEGNRFLVVADLGFGVMARIEVLVDGFVMIDQAKARKEAQRLLHGADLVIRGIEPTFLGRAWVCDVLYGPYHEPRSEQANFKAAMLASGYVSPV